MAIPVNTDLTKWDAEWGAASADWRTKMTTFWKLFSDSRNVIEGSGKKQNPRGNAGFQEFMGAVGFEPTKAEPSDLQSDPFVHFGTRPPIRQWRRGSGG